VDNARFRKPVVPGDSVEIHVAKRRRRGSVWKFNCQAKVNGEVVAEAVIAAMILDE
jgi:3-hydroxyacyl-[acyl-carrier-protein] dehydratase